MTFSGLEPEVGRALKGRKGGRERRQRESYSSKQSFSRESLGKLSVGNSTTLILEPLRWPT